MFGVEVGNDPFDGWMLDEEILDGMFGSDTRDQLRRRVLTRIKGEFHTTAMALNHPCGGLLDNLLRVDQIDDQPALVADRGAQGCQAAVANDFATSNDHDTLTQGLNIVHIMRCENDCHPIVAIEHFDKIAYRQLRDSIEANGRLIEKQEARPME